MKTLEEYKTDFLSIGRMFLSVLQTDEMVESFSVTRFAYALAAIFSAGGCFPREDAFDDLFFGIEGLCRKTNPFKKNNHDTVLSILMFCLLLEQSSRELHEEYTQIDQLKKDFGAGKGRMMLEYIADHPGCLQKDLADYMKMTKSSMSHYLAKNRKYQLWDTDKVGRSNYLTITPEGRRFIQFMNERISKEEFPHDAKEEIALLKEQLADLRERYQRLLTTQTLQKRLNNNDNNALMAGNVDIYSSAGAMNPMLKRNILVSGGSRTRIKISNESLEPDEYKYEFECLKNTDTSLNFIF